MNKNRLWQTFSELSSIYSPSFKERQFCDLLKEKLTALGVKCYEDNTGEHIEGNCGNLYGFLEAGSGVSQSPVLFSAHMDTVEPSFNKRAILLEDERIVSDGSTILGADDVAGITIILEAIERLKEQKIKHRPIELLFPVAEEYYGKGSAAFDYSRLKSKEAYILDLEGELGEAANAAPTLISFSISVEGKASHAGFAPNEGINAILVAARAIARIPQGEPKKGVTCNIGMVSGGEASNIVPEFCKVKGEIRSLSHNDALAQWNEVKTVFIEEGEAVGATVKDLMQIEITAYETPMKATVINRFKKACKAIGVQANIHTTLGGSDNNNFALHGIEGIVMACSMYNVHSTREYCRLDELEAYTKMVMFLMAEEEL